MIKGVWFKPPGTPVGCVFKVGANDAAECAVKGGTGGATFAPTNIQALLATPIAADATCSPGDGRAGCARTATSTPTACTFC